MTSPGFLTCSFCRGPILPIKEGKWNHVSSRTEGHIAMPEPKGKSSIKLGFYAPRLAIIHDALKTFEKKMAWVGPHYTRNEGEGYRVEFAVLSEESEAALTLGLECGLEVPGKFRHVSSKRKEEDDGDRSVSGGTPVRSISPRASGPVTKIAEWWQCPTCKRRIKGGMEFHYSRPNALKCKEAADVRT